MIHSSEIAIQIKQHKVSVVKTVSQHFSQFFNEVVADQLVHRGGYMQIDADQFLSYMREKQKFDAIHNINVINQFIEDLLELGYIAQFVCPSMNPDHITIEVA